MHWDKTQILKKFPSDKINGTKIPSFFFSEPQIYQFYSEFAILIWGEA